MRCARCPGLFPSKQVSTAPEPVRKVPALEHIQGNIMQDSTNQVMVQQRHKVIMQKKEWTKIRHNTRFDIGLLHAYYVQHAYPRHSHDYYVISLIERGRQSFTHKGRSI